MKKLINLFRDRHLQVFKVLLFVLAAALIVAIFPREGKFKYGFQKGKPWAHEDLIAPFDFPIYKSTETLEAEQKEIEENKQLYFTVDLRVAENQLNRFDREFDQLWGELEGELQDLVLGKTSNKRKQERLYAAELEKLAKAIDANLEEKSLETAYQRKGKQLLTNLFERGILAPETQLEGQEADYSLILLKNNVAEDKELGELLTINSASQKISNDLNRLSEPAFSFLKETLEDYLAHNVFYDESKTEEVMNERLSKFSITAGIHEEGKRVIARGDMVDEENFLLLSSLKKEYEERKGVRSQYSVIMLGQIILVLLVLSAFGLYLLLFRKEIIEHDLKISFLLLLIFLFVWAAKWAIGIEVFSIYLVPFCILPLVVRTFFDARTALFSHLVTVLIVGFIAPNSYEFIFVEMITGIITIFSVLSLKNRSQLFTSSLVIFGAYSFAYFGLSIVQEGSFTAINWAYFGWFVGSALLTLFTYPLVYLFEKVFGFVSDVTLMELSDTNNKLLRDLNLKAPGTFQHSLQVANLAEEAIREIGGNTLLMRTGALYHDIGKMINPIYFIENQAGGHNPHDELSPEESAGIIIDHVIKGIEMARKANLPDIVIDFIRTHHGTSRTEYFYQLSKKERPEEEVDAADFTYPGPVPYSKETAVLMMADSVEAASRSLKSYDANSITQLVENIINHQIAAQQFVAADITFKDIGIIKKLFIKKLMNIYHVRIAYN